MAEIQDTIAKDAYYSSGAVDLTNAPRDAKFSVTVKLKTAAAVSLQMYDRNLAAWTLCLPPASVAHAYALDETSSDDVWSLMDSEALITTGSGVLVGGALAVLGVTVPLTDWVDGFRGKVRLAVSGAQDDATSVVTWHVI